MIGILTDITKCIGCEKCVEACKSVNHLPEDRFYSWQSGDGLSSSRWTTIIVRNFGNENRYVRKQCMHCLDPACVSVCIVGALKKTPEGPVIYDSTKCIGCRYCILACPFGIPKYSWEDKIPYVKKCTLCYERLHEGKIPACVEACPTGATIFGDRDELIREARRRIKSNPDRYLPHIYGISEVGGTSVLYISDENLDFLGRKPYLGNEPLPPRTESILHSLPPVFFGVGAVLAGIHWIVQRREIVRKKEKSREENNADSDSTA